MNMFLVCLLVLLITGLYDSSVQHANVVFAFVSTTTRSRSSPRHRHQTFCGSHGRSQSQKQQSIAVVTYDHPQRRRQRQRDDEATTYTSLSAYTMDRRRALWRGAAVSGVATATTIATAPPAADAEIASDANWPLWTALPVAPYARRKTLRREIIPHRVWTFEQLIGIYYVHVPIRMTVVAVDEYAGGNASSFSSSSSSSSPSSSSTAKNDTKMRGLVVYAPVAPTVECLRLLRELEDVYGPVRGIILPSVAVEHKVNAGPFARRFPDADFYVTDKQYSFPLPLPSSFLGFPAWAKPLPMSSMQTNVLGPEFEYQVLTVQPGPGSMYQDVALFHKPSRTLMVCDAVLAVTEEPPIILTQEPEYTRALLFHARDDKDETVPDTHENRRKGWRRIVLLFNFFFPGSGTANLGLGPIGEALRTPLNPYGWGG